MDFEYNQGWGFHCLSGLISNLVRCPGEHLFPNFSLEYLIFQLASNAFCPICTSKKSLPPPSLHPHIKQLETALRFFPLSPLFRVEKLNCPPPYIPETSPLIIVMTFHWISSSLSALFTKETQTGHNIPRSWNDYIP